MLSYNVSYILNLPAKLIANIRTDLDILYIEDVVEKSGIFNNIVVKGSIAIFIIRDILIALIGFILAIIMVPLGLIIGFIYHPIQTFYDIIPCLWGTLKTTFYAIKHLFY